MFIHNIRAALDGGPASLAARAALLAATEVVVASASQLHVRATGLTVPSTVHMCNAGVPADISPISAVVPLAGTMTASLVDPAGARDLQ